MFLRHIRTRNTYTHTHTHTFSYNIFKKETEQTQSQKKKRKENAFAPEKKENGKNVKEKQDNEKLQPSVCMSIFVLVCKMSQGRLGVCSFFFLHNNPPSLYLFYYTSE